MVTLNGFTPEQLEDIAAELRLGWQVKAVQAEMRRREIARINSQEQFWGDDMVVTMRMDPVVNLYWKLREGNGVWEDGFHRRYFRKHFPECFTKPRSPKTQVGYRGGPSAAPGTANGTDGTNGANRLVDRTGCAISERPPTTDH